MRLATLRTDSGEKLHYQDGDYFIPVAAVNTVFGTFFPDEFLPLLQSGELDDMRKWYAAEGPHRLSRLPEYSLHKSEVEYAPLFRRPPKIWCIGLNYREHAADLDTAAPTGEPGSFMRPANSLIGPGDEVKIPRSSEKTTGEGELTLVLREHSGDLTRENWLQGVAGFVAAIDMCAEDLLRRNVRNLTASKSFPTFLSLGSIFVTPDEVPDVKALNVQTVLNGEVKAENTAAHMTFTPDVLIEYHSRIFPFEAGDLLLTGTPGAAALSDGDTIECRIEGLETPDMPTSLTLANPVVDLKKIESATAT